MSRAINKLTATFVKAAPPGKYSDGGGLWLIKRADGGGQWMQRVTVHGRRREMGLGGIYDVSLKDARALSDQARKLAVTGSDPIKDRLKQRLEAAKELHTLNSVAAQCFEARKAQLKDNGRAARWMGPLASHVLPKLGEVPVAELDQNDIRQTMTPIWHEKAAVAIKAIDRLGIVIEFAAAMGLNVDIQATAKAKALLGKQRHSVVHVPSMQWSEVPAYFASLSELVPTQLALRFLILTAARSAEVRLFNLNELKGDVWVIPAERMKAGKEHRVPLSREALAVLQAAQPFECKGYLFNGNKGTPISDMTLSMFMRRQGLDARPHGFRSSFRTWCAEATDVPREIAEAALAHITGSEVERAYRRTDYLERRVELMQRWADHVSFKICSND